MQSETLAHNSMSLGFCWMDQQHTMHSPSHPPQQSSYFGVPINGPDAKLLVLLSSNHSSGLQSLCNPCTHEDGWPPHVHPHVTVRA